MLTAALLATLAPSLRATPVDDPSWTQWALAVWRWNENALKNSEDGR